MRSRKKQNIIMPLVGLQPKRPDLKTELEPVGRTPVHRIDVNASAGASAELSPLTRFVTLEHRRSLACIGGSEPVLYRPAWSSGKLTGQVAVTAWRETVSGAIVHHTRTIGEPNWAGPLDLDV